MAHRAVKPAYGGVQRERYVPHDRFLSGRWSGVIEVGWRIDPDHPVAIGAGWFELQAAASSFKRVRPRSPLGRRMPQPAMAPQRRDVVAEIVRRGAEKMPVLPGSSLKGAIRQVYELLTPSCQPAVRGACRVPPKVAEPEICPACSLFGAAGLGGRLSFGEAAPADDVWRVKQISVPTAWRPRRDHPGTVKVYDQRAAIDPRTGTPQKRTESTRCVFGEFRSRVRLINASEEELGLLFGALGLGAASPMLRIGGRKFDGLGGTDVRLLGCRQNRPRRSRLAAEEAQEWAMDLLQRAIFERAERKHAWDELHAALSVV